MIKIEVKERKMKVKILSMIKYVFEIVLIIIVSFMYYLNQPIESPKVLYIPSGSITKIITHLKSSNQKISKLDGLLLRLIGSPQSGWINVRNKHNTKADFLYKLTTAKAALQNITLIPGETSFIFLKQLSQQLQLNSTTLQNEYKKQVKFHEGSFVPNTYKIPIGITEHALIKLLLKVSYKNRVALSKKIFGTYNAQKWLQYVTIASIIQKESANKSEMPLVSSVIYNRLKKGMKLQMDGTLNYGKYSHVKVTPKRIKEDRTTYNTYKHRGLPDFPVCNVSDNAIVAAIFPAKTKYLYFMKSKKGTHDFSCNYSTHLKYIKHATK